MSKLASTAGIDCVVDYDLCEERLGYRFANRELLREALTHASGASHRLGSNERLEFLGDAILGKVVCEILYQRFPEDLEGELTKVKSVVVSRRTCTKLSRELGLRDFLILGKGMSSSEVVPPSLLSDVFESLVAAIHLDGGDQASTAFITRIIGPEIDAVVGGDHGGNYKSILQQLAQRDYGQTPTYRLLDEKGPDHSKCFKISAVVGPRGYAPAWGRNKKDAEQRAARNALSEIAGEDVPFPAE